MTSTNESWQSQRYCEIKFCQKKIFDLFTCLIQQSWKCRNTSSQFRTGPVFVQYWSPACCTTEETPPDGSTSHIPPLLSHAHTLPTTTAITTSGTSPLKSIRKRSIVNLEFNHWNSVLDTRHPYVSHSYAEANLCRRGFVSTGVVKPHAKFYCLLVWETL